MIGNPKCNTCGGRRFIQAGIAGEELRDCPECRPPAVKSILVVMGHCRDANSVCLAAFYARYEAGVYLQMVNSGKIKTGFEIDSLSIESIDIFTTESQFR